MLFVAMLLALLAIGFLVRGNVPPRPHGLPDDPAVAEAREMLAGGLPIPARDLYLVTALAGVSGYVSGDSLPLDRLAAARGRLREAAARHPRDPRLRVAIAHVDLAAGRLPVAERGYRAALREAPRYGEARLGLAVTLALRAEQEAEPIRVRAKRLAAIGQLANVEPEDPAYAPALVSRVGMLRTVGRDDEASRVAREALRDSLAEPWATHLRRMARRELE